MKSSTNYLKHILDETTYLLDASNDLTQKEFLQSATLQRAFVRSLEIIGEAVKNTPPEIKVNHPDIEWRKMAATRDRLIHGYFSVDFELVWDIVCNKIPDLNHSILNILTKME